MTTPIIAPPSAGANKSDILAKLQQLSGGLAQGQKDGTLVQSHINNWATYTSAQKDSASLDVLNIVGRLIQDVSILAIGVNDIIGAESIVPK